MTIAAPAALQGPFSGGMRPPAPEMVQRLSPLALAYIGDAVWECETRTRLLWPPSKVDTLHGQVQQLVCAEGQQRLLERLIKGFGLSEDELDWVRRGRNASGRGPRRLDPKTYRASTSFETLVGVCACAASELQKPLVDAAVLSACMGRSLGVRSVPH